MPTRLIALTSSGIGIASENATTQTENGQWTRQEYTVDLPLTCLAARAADGRSDPDALLAGTQGEGVWHSADGGQHWEPFALPGVIVKSITVTPERILVGTKNPPLIYACENAGTHAGQHWNELTGFRAIPSRPYWFSPAEKPYTAYVMGVDHAAGNPNHLVAGMEAGAVVSSQNGGATWSDHQPGTMRDCHAIGFHPRDPHFAYAIGGSSQGAALSRDGGQSWIDCRAGLSRHYAWAFAADPQEPERWFVAVAPGPRQAHGDDGNAQAYIFRRARNNSNHNIGTQDTGAQNADTQNTDTNNYGWEQLGGGLPQPLPSMPYSLVIPPAQPGTLYAGLRNGQIYRSLDLGDHWELLPIRFDGIRRTLLVQIF